MIVLSDPKALAQSLNLPVSSYSKSDCMYFRGKCNAKNGHILAILGPKHWGNPPLSYNSQTGSLTIYYHQLPSLAHFPPGSYHFEREVPISKKRKTAKQQFSGPLSH